MRTLISYIILCFVCFAFLCVQMFSLLSIFKKQANFSLLHIFYLCPFYFILWKYVQLLWTLICYIISCFVCLALRTNVLIALNLYEASQFFLVTSFFNCVPLLHNGRVCSIFMNVSSTNYIIFMKIFSVIYVFLLLREKRWCHSRKVIRSRK